MKDVKQLIEDYLEEVIIMQLATSDDSQPWCCSLHYAFDDDFNLYWISTPETRHSKEISKNPKVAGTIVREHKKEDKPRGLSFQGTAREITDANEIRKLITAYEKRFDWAGAGAEIISGKNPHHLYQIKPEKFIYIDAVNFPGNSQELKLY